MALLPGEANQYPPPAKGFEDVTFDPADNSAQVITVIDSNVVETSIIRGFIRPATGRDSDELEADPIIVTPGVIVPGVSFSLVVTPANELSNPEGTFRVLYERW